MTVNCKPGVTSNCTDVIYRQVLVMLVNTLPRQNGPLAWMPQEKST